MADLMEKIVSLTKRRGFVFPGSEIYGGFAGTYDWGPVGVELRRNIVNAWIAAMQEHENITFIDSSIFTAPEVWKASGHVSGFNDPMVRCLKCRGQWRADHLIEAAGRSADEKMSETELNQLFDSVRDQVACPACGQKKFGKIVHKNLMATSTLGRFTDEDGEVYLRAETAQGIYINYRNVLDLGVHRVPFGIGQVGKAFRNEISPRQFLFRKREFEQMEMQYFTHPKDAPAFYRQWKEERMRYYINLGITPSRLRWKQHENLVFYAKDAWDIEYEYPFGWSELEGVHYRGDYDLTQHQRFSGVNMSYFDEKTNERYIPHVIETSVGVDRTVLMALTDAYYEDEMGEGGRVVLRFPPALAPIKAAVFPLLRNKPKLVARAREVYQNLKKYFTSRQFGPVMFDDNGNIGKRYRRQDEIGTPYCVTIDFETLENETVTVRDRDSGGQIRLAVVDLPDFFSAKL